MDQTPSEDKGYEPRPFVVCNLVSRWWNSKDFEIDVVNHASCVVYPRMISRFVHRGELDHSPRSIQ
jgi:hypothetical protein